MPELKVYKNPFYNDVLKYVKDELNRRRLLHSQEKRENDYIDYLAKEAVVEVKCYNKDNLSDSLSFMHRDGGLTSMYESNVKDSDNRRYIPRPTILSVNVSNEGRYGTIRRAEINFKVYSIQQLEQYGQYYFRPGNVIEIDYGWSGYVTNKKENPNGTKYKGYVYNFSFSARQDGGFDCQTQSIGEGFFVLGVDTSSSVESKKTKTVSGVLSGKAKMSLNIADTIREGDLMATNMYEREHATSTPGIVNYPYEYSIYTDSKLTYVNSYIYQEMLDIINKIGPKVWSGYDENYRAQKGESQESIAKEKEQELKKGEESRASIALGSDEYESRNYIILGEIIDMLNYIVIYIKKETDPTFEQKAFIYCSNYIQTDDNVQSADPFKVILPYSIYSLYTDGQIDQKFPSYTAPGNTEYFSKQSYKKPDYEQPDVKGDRSIKPESTIEASSINNSTMDGYSLISDILLNVKLIGDILVSSINTNSIKELELSIKDFLQKIFDQISTLTGGIYNLTAYMDIDDDGNDFIDIADINFSEEINEFTPFSFKPFTKDSIVSVANIESNLPDKMATAAYIGGAAASGMPISAFDVFKYKIGGDSWVWNPTVGDYGELQLTTKEKVQFEIDKNNTMKRLYRAYSELFANYNDTTINSLISALKAYKTYGSIEKTWNKKVIYPIKSNLTMEGITGFRFGNIVKLEWLPEIYKERMVFMVTKVNHTIENNTWKTDLELQCRLK